MVIRGMHAGEALLAGGVPKVNRKFFAVHFGFVVEQREGIC